MAAITLIAIALIIGFFPGQQAAHGLAWMGLVMAVVLAGISVLGGILFFLSNRTFDRRHGIHL